jgi:hypothetical protein
MNVQELEGAELDAAVTSIEENDGGPPLFYSKVWSIAGPIIERERISIEWCEDRWTASHPANIGTCGPTPLIAAMRAFVASRGTA